MESIEKDGLEELDAKLSDILERAPEARRELHERLADELKQEVDMQIANSVNDSNGEISGWQEPHVGSGGGYAAVRPTDSSSGPDSPGAITNYLENGHAIRNPSGRAKNYRPAIHTPYVDGRHFYEATRASADSKVIAAADEFAEELREKLSG